MRIVAEENHQKTNQLLYTAPVSITKIILGKFFAVVSLFGIGILVICLYPLILNMYGTDVRSCSRVQRSECSTIGVECNLLGDSSRTDPPFHVGLGPAAL